MAISSISNDTSPAFPSTLSQQLILGEIILLLAVSFLTVRDANEPNLWQALASLLTTLCNIKRSYHDQVLSS